MAFGEIWGLVFAGDFDTAEQRSADVFRISSPGQYLAWGMVNVLASTVEVARGRFSDAVSRMEQTVAALTAESTAAWIFLARLLLAQSYCALGQVEPAATMVTELRSLFGRHLGVFEPQLRLTEAWLAAARGHVSAAIELALHAGDIAQRSGRSKPAQCSMGLPPRGIQIVRVTPCLDPSAVGCVDVGPGQDRIQHGVFGLIDGGQGEVHGRDRVTLR